ncbi:MAG: hypothetical protein JO359_12215 [Candidatus Eremiobacteraeota bacterium]|nr:hypothetical protein [Candidatus Eremiobacteraeota bacterium]
MPLTTLVNLIVAPGEAFASIRARPVWSWALLVLVILVALASIVSAPVSRHIVETTIPAQLANDPRFAGLPPEQAQAQIQRVLGIALLTVSFGWLLAAVVACVVVLFAAGILFAAVARTAATFKQVFTLVVHVQVIGAGLYGIVNATIAALRPVESFRTTSDYATAIPSLAWLLPASSSVKLVAFLAALHPFAIWATILLALGLIAVAGARRWLAWTLSIAITLFGATLAAALAR